MTWEEWRAQRINRIFAEFGATHKTGQFTADTVKHGELARSAAYAVEAEQQADPQRAAESGKQTEAARACQEAPKRRTAPRSRRR